MAADDALNEGDTRNEASSAPAPALWAFGGVIFTGAFLLFQVQPLIGKYILPWFGGGPGIWTTCLLFFQVMLFAGYAYAHWLSGRALAQQIKIHLVLLALALLTLPITPSDQWKPGPGEEPMGRILLLLIASVGLPYLVLASTGPLAQAWFSRANPGRSPYRLYALSNVGSLLALITFPFVVEPSTTRTMQVNGWSLATVFYIGLFGWVAWQMRSIDGETSNDAPPKKEAVEPAPSLVWNVPLWLLLPACGTVLLMSTTNLICQEIAVIPFLWVVPLALYLLTFIIAFDSPRWYLRPLFVAGFLASAGASCWALNKGVDLSIQKQLGIFISTLFFGCMVCHGEVFRLRPPSHKLTAYYLCISGGGALGGLFVSLGAPALFQVFFWEFHLGLGLCGLLAGVLWLRSVWSASRMQLVVVCVLMTAALQALTWGLSQQMKRIQTHVSRTGGKSLYATRNFYGLLKVNEWPAYYPGGTNALTAKRDLLHGRISHGGQYVDPALALRPITYFGPQSGIGLTLTHVREGGAKRVGVLGLGTGSAAVYARAGDRFRFYEINAAVEHVAENHFTYLRSARDRGAEVDVVLGDGRLMLEMESKPMKFDVISMDAFSSDSVPVHLLTNEAFEIYEKHLSPGGVIVINITNRYLDLAPVMWAVSGHRNLHLRIIHHWPNSQLEPWFNPTTYVLLSPREDFFEQHTMKKASLASHETFAKQLRKWLKNAGMGSGTDGQLTLDAALQRLLETTATKNPGEEVMIQHARQIAGTLFIQNKYYANYTLDSFLDLPIDKKTVPVWTDDYSSLFSILK